jgi:hypothetical protein
MTEDRLKLLLTATAELTRYPPTPDLSRRVLASLDSQTESTPRPSRHSLALALSVALAILIVASLLLAPSRHAVARFFGVEGSKIERLPPTRPGATAFSTPVGLDGLATPVALADLSRLAGFEAAIPVGQGPPLQAYLIFYSGQVVVVLHYQRFDLWQTHLPQSATFGKLVPDTGIIQDVLVGSEPGRWVTGAPHFVYYTDRAGNFILASQRALDRNTLIWRTPGTFYRVETELTLNEALEIAETLP